ncbi:hypothetical protein BDF14DRAFT_1813313 [Spinellus fusiger]|nr:hypothetical protein BDF14DRAFT_1813313 [Spinellus fusiger]
MDPKAMDPLPVNLKDTEQTMWVDQKREGQQMIFTLYLFLLICTSFFMHLPMFMLMERSLIISAIVQLATAANQSIESVDEIEENKHYRNAYRLLLMLVEGLLIDSIVIFPVAKKDQRIYN